MISREEIVHIYQLAKLELKEEEIEETRRKFSEVFEYVSDTLEVNMEGPFLQMLGKAPCELREDVPEEGLSREDALKHAYETEYGYFRLDRVVE